MMPAAYLGLVAALLALDAALSRWTPSKPHALRSAIALVLAYVPILVVPRLPPIGVTLAAAAAGTLGLVSFARLVGLSGRPLALTVLSALSFFVAARVHWYGLFQAMPVFAMFFAAGAGTIGSKAHTFLQRTGLSWVALLVYGYLFAHAAVFTDVSLGALAPAPVWISVILVCAKSADVLWEAAKKVRAGAEDLQLAVCPVGGALGGAAVHLTAPDLLPLPKLATLWLIVGLGLGAASRTYKLIVADVVGEDPERPMKGTMLFGFAFALALAYHYVSYLAG
jgi:hypothetical protein